jgi:hypothetical protein
MSTERNPLDTPPGAAPLQTRYENQATIEAIRDRAAGASSKVQGRVRELFLPRIVAAAGRNELQLSLDSLRDSFHDLFEGRTPEVFAQAYEGWTDAEKQELHGVIFGPEGAPSTGDSQAFDSHVDFVAARMGIPVPDAPAQPTTIAEPSQPQDPFDSHVDFIAARTPKRQGEE